MASTLYYEKNETMKRRTLFITIGIVMLVSLIIPIFYFWLRFKSFNVSSNVSDWGDFGSYAGGVMTPIISIYSVVILGYITYLLSKNSNEENKNLYILQKKLDAYEELMKYFPRFNQAPLKLKYLLEGLVRDLPESGNDKELLNQVSERILIQLEFFVEFHYFLFNFNPRYSHLFKYDFESNDYRRSIGLSSQIKDNFLSIYDGLTSLNISVGKVGDNIGLIDEMMDYLVNFINDIRTELK